MYFVSTCIRFFLCVCLCMKINCSQEHVCLCLCRLKTRIDSCMSLIFFISKHVLLSVCAQFHLRICVMPLIHSVSLFPDISWAGPNGRGKEKAQQVKKSCSRAAPFDFSRFCLVQQIKWQLSVTTTMF